MRNKRCTQTNGNYKIRQIITKIIEYIHPYIYTHKQNQNSTKVIMYNSLIQQINEPQNYIHQLRTKLTRIQTEKQK